jgi:hypothetical protein
VFLLPVRFFLGFLATVCWVLGVPGTVLRAKVSLPTGIPISMSGVFCLLGSRLVGHLVTAGVGDSGISKSDVFCRLNFESPFNCVSD